MRTFKDSQGRPWNISITVASLQRVKSMVGIDITKLTEGDPPIGVRLTTEPTLIGEVLYAIVATQATAQGVTADDFAESLDGDALAAAFDCLHGELTDFFQKSGRKEQATALKTQLRVLQAASTLATEKMESLDVQALVESALSTCAGNVPESSASIPAN
jgi:hypothetical protein